MTKTINDPQVLPFDRHLFTAVTLNTLQSRREADGRSATALVPDERLFPAPAEAVRVDPVRHFRLSAVS